LDRRYGPAHLFDAGSIGSNVVDADVKSIFRESDGNSFATSFDQRNILQLIDDKTHIPREEPVTIAVLFP